ncbi:MAG: pilus assembly protein [Candidatus Dormibacteraeota bacterium]|nr:pilus assembly protein [Candidatus Dormibacteraeota bacterium]
MTRRRGGNRAQSLVEMALITPLLFFILLGIVDIGRAYYQYTVMTDAVREGARFVSAQWTNSAGGGAATNSNAASAPFNTVQGRIQYVGYSAGMTFTNDAAHMAVTYYDGTSAALTQCAHWNAVANTIVQDNSYPITQPRTGDIVKVHLSYTFTPIVPLISQVMGAALTLTADSQVRIE